MSGLPAPAVAPSPPVFRPEVVPPRPKKRGSRRIWILLILCVLVGVVIALIVSQKKRSAPAQGAAGTAAIRTAQVTTGSVERTLRLTGVTAAANYVSLITPNLRGSRSGYGRDSSATSTAASTTASSTASTSSTSNSSAGTSSAPNASSAFTSATSRLGTASSGTSATSSSTSSSTASASSASTSSAMGSGLGSTASSLPATTGGGGAGNDFMLILQKVAPAGVAVHKGAEIAEFDRQYMLLRLDDYKASVVQSEAGLNKRVADLRISHRSHEQLVLAAKGALEKARLDLKSIPVLSDIDAEKARLAFEQAQAKYQQLLKEVPFVLASEQADTRVSELDLQQAKLELTRAEVNTAKMISKAPIDGLVVMQSMFRGAEFGQIQQGDQLWPGQFYMQVVDPRAMVINATVNQVDVEHVRIGQRARIHFDAYPDLELPAHVESIAAVTKPGTFRAQFVKDVAVRIKIDRMDKRVIPDLSVSAEIVEETDDRPPAVAPLAAIFRDNSNVPYVYVQSDGAWQRRKIEIGIYNNLVAAVKAGVKPGEVLALDPPSSSESPQVFP